MDTQISSLIHEHIIEVEKLQSLVPMICKAAMQICNCLKSDATIFWMGNGGSAADSQHMAAEFVGRFVKERRALKSVALTTDSSILTAIGNDYGYDKVFSRQVEALCGSKDILIAISTSGNSTNCVEAINAAKQKGTYTIGLLGRDGGQIASLVDMSIIVPCNSTARIQECHILICHIFCEMVDQYV